MTAGHGAFGQQSSTSTKVPLKSILFQRSGSAKSTSLSQPYAHHASHVQSKLKYTFRPPARCSLMLGTLRKAYVRRGATTLSSTAIAENVLTPPASPKVMLDSSRRTLAPLKLDFDDELHNINNNNNYEDDGDLLLKPMGHRHRVVYFEPQVLIVEIPSRNAYSPEVAGSLWNSRKQIRHLAARNIIEYAFERRDWRNAVEEDRFYRYGEQLVHPAHIVVVQHQHQHHQELKVVHLQRGSWSSCCRLRSVAPSLYSQQYKPWDSCKGENS